MSNENISSNGGEKTEDNEFDFLVNYVTFAPTENFRSIESKTTDESTFIYGKPLFVDGEDVIMSFENEDIVQEIMLKGGRAKPSKTKKTVAKKTKKDVEEKEEKEEIEEQEEQVEKAKIKREPVNSTTKKVRKTKSVKAEKEDR